MTMQRRAPDAAYLRGISRDELGLFYYYINSTKKKFCYADWQLDNGK